MTESFNQSETFEPVAGLKKTTALAGLTLLIPLAFPAWVIITLILSAVGLPVPWLFGIALSAVFVVVLSMAKDRQLTAMTSAMSLTMDERGITEKNNIATRFVSWDGLREARMVKPVVGMSTGKVGRGQLRSRTAGVDAYASAVQVQELGLVGVGTIELSTDANAMNRQTYQQNEGRNGTDAVTGQPLVALYLQQFDPQWPEGRIGAWIQRRRPDIFDQGKAAYDQRAHDASLSMRQLAKESWAKGKAQAVEENAAAEKTATEDAAEESSKNQGPS